MKVLHKKNSQQPLTKRDAEPRHFLPLSGMLTGNPEHSAVTILDKRKQYVARRKATACIDLAETDARVVLRSRQITCAGNA